MFQDEFGKMKEKYSQAMKELALKRTSSAISTSDELMLYELVPVERRFDAFGSWEIDKLFGHMKIYLLVTSPSDPKKQAAFPGLWRTTREVKKEASK